MAKRATEKVKTAKAMAKETEARQEEFVLSFATLANVREVKIALSAIHRPTLDGILVVP